MKKLVTYLGRMISYAFLFLVCTYSNAATYYFSSTYGDDARSSAQAQNQNSPWKSIQKLNSVFNSLQPGDNIMFRNGDTFHGTLIINKSGTSGAPISFGNYGSGENPVLTGFREIKDWVSLGGNVYETYIPEVSSSVSTVVMNDVLQAMGRYPNDNASNSGYLTINSYSGGSIGSSGLQAPSSMTGGEIVIRKNNWIIDRHVINWHSGSSVNYNTAGSAYSPTIGYGFFIQNHPATLDKHGEWYFNKATKKLMIYFQGNPSGANIKVSTIDRIINTQNSASHIKLNNLTIQGSNENLINIDKSTFFTVENCLLEYVGKNAINTIMSRNLTVSNSYISNALNGGINLGWDDRATVVRSSTFSKIHAIAGMGQSADSQGNGIFMSETTSDVLIEYNEFLENGSNAIYFNGNNINIKNNLIDTFCFVKDDGGGIYTFTGPANTTFTNRKITNNIIVNGIGAVDGTKPYGATDFPYVEGIYLDLFANGIDIDQNTIGNVMSKGIFVNNARNVSITNNKIFNAGYSIFITSDYTNNLTRNITLTNNEFLNKDSNQLHVFVRSKVNTLGQMGTFDKNIYSRPINESNSFSLQVPEKNGLIDLQSWKSSYGLDANSTKSPASYESKKMGIDEFIMFEFNNSKSSKTIPLSGTYVDLKGKILSGSVVVPAYSSILLLKTEASTTPENTAPTVSITAPSTDSQFVQGDNISITSVATDTDGTISKVEFYNGTTLLGTDTSAPYSFDWTNLPIGNFSITAKATDNKGMATISDLVKINVHEKANVAPLVSITAPSTNSQFIQGDNLTITSNASNADGTLTKVEFYHENTLLGTDISAPYSFDWINLPIGSFSITAKATDNKGNSTVSEVVNIKINEKVSRSPFGGK
ncbi:Ig-like domain-containing protein, partial [Algoriphagus ratkowskyi]